jgi:hypothetical protein
LTEERIKLIWLEFDIAWEVLKPKGAESAVTLRLQDRGLPFFLIRFERQMQVALVPQLVGEGHGVFDG